MSDVYSDFFFEKKDRDKGSREMAIKIIGSYLVTKQNYVIQNSFNRFFIVFQIKEIDGYALQIFIYDALDVSSLYLVY